MQYLSLLVLTLTMLYIQRFPRNNFSTDEYETEKRENMNTKYVSTGEIE